MSSGIDAARQSADHGQACISKLVRKFLRCIRCRNGWCVERRSRQWRDDHAPEVRPTRRALLAAHESRVMAGIRQRLLRDHSGAEIADPLKLRGKINR